MKIKERNIREKNNKERKIAQKRKKEEKHK